ncbi:MAG: hypothetical protein HYS81_02670 [Candidatus Aenigmatarchaeota archaeon]|nr:MAG: hypothetical protein HYS81_02670 [Candidatus Aenigmarchaeota archaeon]
MVKWDDGTISLFILLAGVLLLIVSMSFFFQAAIGTAPVNTVTSAVGLIAGVALIALGLSGMRRAWR